MAEIIRQVMTSFGACGEGFSIQDAEVDSMYEAYSGPRAAYYVVEESSGDRIVGGAGVAPLENGDPGTCELKKMYFLPEARGHGIGRELLEQCLAQARRLGFDRCYLETLSTMTDARRLYERAGFEPLSGPLGNTGHFGCDAWYAIELNP